MRISDWSSDVCSSDLISKIPIPANDEIIVTATRAITRTPKGGTGLPTGAEIYNKIGSAVGGKLDKALGTKFFKGIGGQLGSALQGAGTDRKSTRLNSSH